MTHPAERQEYAASLSFEILYRPLLFRNCKIGCLSSYHATQNLPDVSRAVDESHSDLTKPRDEGVARS